MAKRFTDTNKWRKPFIRTLQAPYKLLWFYILDDCDHSGIWIVDFEVAQIRIGEPISEEEALKIFADKVTVFDNNERWFIPDFIEFQYGMLNESNRAHNSVINSLLKYKLINKNKVLISPLQGVKDKEMDKDKDKEKEQKYKEFYREQWEISNDGPLGAKYQHIIKYIMNLVKNVIDEPGEHILKLKKQLSYEQFITLNTYCSKRTTTIKEMIDSWLNKPSYSNGRVSVYAVLQKWASKAPIQGTNLSEPKTPLVQNNIGKQ